MKKILSLSISFLIICFGLVASGNAQGNDVGVDLGWSCPTSVKVGAALFVTITPYNWDDCQNSITLTRAMTGLVGNSGGTLGGTGIWGPYNKTFSPWTVGAATCDQYGNVISPGSGATRSLKIIDSVPSTLVGTNAMAYFGFLNSSGHEMGSGMCMITIVP